VAILGHLDPSPRLLAELVVVRLKTGTPQTKKRNTKPKGMGAIQLFQKHHGFAAMAAKLLNDSATQLVVEASQVRDSRSLTKAQKVGTGNHRNL